MAHTFPGCTPIPLPAILADAPDQGASKGTLLGGNVVQFFDQQESHPVCAGWLSLFPERINASQAAAQGPAHRRLDQVIVR
jgi:hypothetical protein